MGVMNDIMHPIAWFEGTLDPSGVDPNGSGPANAAIQPAQKSNQTWGQWFGSLFTGTATTIGGATGSTLAAVITPLLPILLILLVVLIVTRVVAEKAVSSI